MKQLNKNNFIVWVGEFNPGAFSVVANNDTATMNKADAKLELYPLNNDFASFGINAASLEITFQDNATKPATWDAFAQKLTYYLPAASAFGDTRQLKYRFKDNAGNLSNEAVISIGVNYPATAWRGLQASFSCLKDSNNENTGLGGFATLERYYTDTNLAVQPAEVKPNAEGDANYIAPATTTQCPLPVESLQLGVFNSAPNVRDFIQNISLYNGGVFVKGFSVSVYSNTPNQPVAIKVPAGTFDEMRVAVANLAGAPRTVQFRAGSGGAGSGSQPVPFASGATGEAVFSNVRFGTNYAGDIILM